ncbi:major capsid protein [Sulfitobacter faviae]|uniref:Major capsid protein n=1 Tax=Sulfitobacter faviae TaxID=1775881 RepID=A0ABZ0V537_9RHOB|nr:MULTISPECIES: major capsid protein [Sulfitobacter]WPZ23113.1 major capsid protein [Sulfitobacter faviae]WPZ28182.1 major capsid protein [Sulfitobacter sp. OXR-159]
MEQFNDPQFSVIALTAALNNQPFVPGQIGDLGIFEEDGVNVTTVEVEEENGVLDLIEPTPRGAPGVTIGDSERNKIPFNMDHFEINDAVYADEVQGVRALGSDDALETIQSRIDSKQERHARAMDNTLEHYRVGAIKGLIVSKSGRVLHNLYDRFGIAVPNAVNLGIGAGEVANLGELLDGVTHSVEDDLDANYDHLHVLTGRTFHTKMWTQKVVRETFLNTNAAEVLRRGIPRVFEFGDMVFERYRTGRKAKTANNNAAYIADDEARLFPVGVPEMYLTRFGPADYEETVNTIGLPRYARQYAMPNGKGRHLDAQMNVINLCTRPGALRRLTIA